MKGSWFTLSLISLTLMCGAALGAERLTCWFPPGWKSKAPQARAIAVALTKASGVTIRPRIAKSYPQILEAFAGDGQHIVYVGSFVQAILKARGLGVPLVQAVNGKELYSGVLVYPKGADPMALLEGHPERVAFARGASSGESSAKAATAGEARIATPNHKATCGAVKAGKAKAGVVKNWWWEGHSAQFPELAMHLIPGVSEAKNPDNVLTASKQIPEPLRERIKAAAIAQKEAFGAQEMVPFDAAKLDFSLELMRKGKIDPLKYSW